MNTDASVRYAKKYLEDILSFFGLNTDVKTHFDGEVIELKVPSTHLNAYLIGQRGDTMRSLQFMISTTLRNQDAAIQRVNVDIADYKQQRADRLTRQAEEWVQKVRDTGQRLALDPMNPADRRVVHNAVSEYSDIATHSEGEGRERHIVIEKVAV